MGEWTLVIHGTGPHHNYRTIGKNVLIPDGEGDYERTTTDADGNISDADLLAREITKYLAEHGQKITGASFTVGRTTDVTQDAYDPIPKQ